MLKFRISISKENGEYVFVRIEEFRNGSYHLLYLFEVTSQMASEMLVYEREKASQGVYKLVIDDKREKFMMC